MRAWAGIRRRGSHCRRLSNAMGWNMPLLSYGIRNNQIVLLAPVLLNNRKIMIKIKGVFDKQARHFTILCPAFIILFLRASICMSGSAIIFAIFSPHRNLKTILEPIQSLIDN